MCSVVLALAACTAPVSGQGQTGQGGSATAPQSSVTITIGGPGGPTTITSAPAAAPSAASTNQAEQRATTDVRPSVALGDSAIKAFSDAYTAALTAGATPAAAELAGRAAAKKATEEKPVETLGGGK
jgi:hypothetical protein